MARLAQGLSHQHDQREALAVSAAQLALDTAPLVMFGTDLAGTFRVVRGSGLIALNMGQMVGRKVNNIRPELERAISQSISLARHPKTV